MQPTSSQSYAFGRIRLNFKISFEKLAAETNQLCVLFKHCNVVQEGSGVKNMESYLCVSYV